ncbi:lysine 2,3-aminomutase [bacterium]|nr:lysine 2,3-aminomutase [bacterium]
MEHGNWTENANPKYRAYTLGNYKQIPQLQNLSPEQIEAVDIVGQVLPFKTNNYMVDNLIDWENPEDPIFILNFPQRGMLIPEHYERMKAVVKTGDKQRIRKTADEIRLALNPHPAGQMELNLPRLKDGTPLPGIQHKYEQTILFFASQGQTCHAYCTFCFRWPQFVGMDSLKIAMKDAEQLVQYVREHPEVTDILFTGGDPLIMRARVLKTYVDALLDAKIEHVKTIRFGTKAMTYWPYKVLTDPDAEETIALMSRIVESGKHLAIMAHINHPRELQTPAARAAIRKVRALGAEVRSQTPILRHINDDWKLWAEKWQEEVSQGIIPYFMFATRDTGAQHYFAVPLARAWDICRKAMSTRSGIGRHIRGLSMSANPGKIQVVGVTEIKGEKLFVLRMLESRNPEWSHLPFFAKYDDAAVWIDDLKPAFGKPEFFYQEELDQMMLGSATDERLYTLSQVA